MKILLEDAIIDALVTIGNYKRVIKEAEPNIMESMELKKWMVKRTLLALSLFREQLNKTPIQSGKKERLR